VVALGSLTVVHRVAPARVQGATTGWLDGGPAGLWQVDPANLARGGDPGTVRPGDRSRVQAPIRPTTPAALLAEVEAGFPEWLRPLLRQS
jgi:hypothetical protein